MISKNDKDPAQVDRSVCPPTPPVNDQGSINVSGYVRVFDPKTQETLVEVRE